MILVDSPGALVEFETVRPDFASEHGSLFKQNEVFISINETFGEIQACTSAADYNVHFFFILLLLKKILLCKRNGEDT